MKQEVNRIFFKLPLKESKEGLKLKTFYNKDLIIINLQRFR